MSAAPPKTTRSPAFLVLARAYSHRKIGRGLDGLHVRGLAAARALALSRPTIFAPTHVSWWDPMLLLVLDEALGTESYALMDARNLEKLPFFGWVGSIPLDRRSPEAAQAGLDLAAALLSGPGKMIWLFPQGRQRPPQARPLGLKPGVAALAARTGAPVVPMAISYHFREAEQPAAFVDFGPPGDPAALGEAGLLPWLEGALDEGLARSLAAATAAADRRGTVEDHGYQPLVGSRGQRADAGLGARLLGAGRRGAP